MKVLAICCSPREGRNTEIVLQEALRGAKEEGADIDFFGVAGKAISPCQGCWTCQKTGKCRIDDDMQDLYQRLKDSDGIIFGSPVYFFDVTAQAKAVIDRTLALTPLGVPLANKVGGIVVTAGSMGTSDAVKSLSMFLGIHRVLVANWVAVYPPVDDKPKGMKAAFDLGREIAQTIGSGSGYSADFRPNHITFGTHTF